MVGANVSHKDIKIKNNKYKQQVPQCFTQIL